MPTQVLTWGGDRWQNLIGSPGVTPPDFVLGTTKPTADNTGVGIVAPAPTETLAGDQTITTADAVIENKIITGQVIVKAANVTLRNCKVVGNASISIGSWLVSTLASAATGFRMEFCELDASAYLSRGLSGIASRRFTAYRCHIHDVVDGGDVFNNDGGATDATFQGNYIHDMLWLYPDPGGGHADGTHDDGIQLQGGSNISIVGNTIMGITSPLSTTGGTGHSVSALMVNSGVGGSATKADITDNWLGGGGYTINGLGTGYSGMVLNIKRNRFDTASAQYGPIGIQSSAGANTWNVPTTGLDANLDLGGNPISIYTKA